MADKRTHPFYGGTAWKAVRVEALKRDGYRCVVCNRSVAGKGQSRVDHILPRSDYPHLSLDVNNLRTLCAEHDSHAHREKGRRGGGGGEREERFVIKGCDVDGKPLDPSHPWNKDEE